MTLKGNSFTAREMLQPLFINGNFVGKTYSAKELRDYCTSEKATLWEESSRLNYPQLIYVDLSDELYNLKCKMTKI